MLPTSHKGQRFFCRSTDNLNRKTVMPGLLQQCDKQEFKLLAWTKFRPHLAADIKCTGQNSQHMVHEPYWNWRVSEFLMPAPMFQLYIFLLNCTICNIYTFIMFRFLCLLLLLWYEACSKSIRPLAGKNTFTRLEVCDPNPLRSSLLVTEHTSPSGSAIVRSISGMPFCIWSTT